jgi:hypothetical protein
MIEKTSRKIFKFLGSDLFFKIIIGWFLLETLWAAFSLVYPMAFDENYHFGIIQDYASQWSPIIDHQPAGTASLGELPYLPSFLFHYLMSFPYRLIHLFTSDQTVTVIILRLLDIAMFTGGLILFKRLLQKIGVSKLIANLSLLMLTFVPSVVLLAAEINYDNLLFLATPIFLIFTLNIVNSLRNNQTINFKDLAWLVIIGTLTSLVKYPFLPIFAAAVVIILVLWLKNKQRHQTWRSIWQSFTKLSTTVKTVLIVLLVISVGLFSYRYGTNIIVLHDIDPNCEKVLSTTDCSSYGPWMRDYTLKQSNLANGTVIHANSPFFEVAWIWGMIHRLYFAINYKYDNFGPLPVQLILVSLIALFGVIFTAIYWRKIRARSPTLWVMLVIIMAYIVSLQYVNYSSYAKLGAFMAINGRYLIPLLPIIFATVALGFSEFFNRVAPHRTLKAKVIFVIIVLFLSLFGAGMFSYIIYADSSWYWPNSPLIGFNQWLQTIITPLTLGGTNQILWWD